MLNLFVTVSGLVVIINIIYSIVPGEKYGRYCKIVVGTITTLAVINVFSGVSDLDLTNNFEADLTSTYENNEVIFDDLVNENIGINIKNMLTDTYGDIIEDVKTQYSNNEIISVTVEIIDNGFSEEIKNKVALYCDINSEKVVIKYI